jgi:hypothetical protein
MGSYKKIILSVLMLTLVAFATAYAKGADVHPEDMGNQDCLQCHQDVTPDIVKQWEQSAHGFTGVKCQVCHGDEDNFVVTPQNNTCEGCHSQQVEMNQAPQAKCASCHISHNFTVHNVHNYK